MSSFEINKWYFKRSGQPEIMWQLLANKATGELDGFTLQFRLLVPFVRIVGLDTQLTCSFELRGHGCHALPAWVKIPRRCILVTTDILPLDDDNMKEWITSERPAGSVTTLEETLERPNPPYALIELRTNTWEPNSCSAAQSFPHNGVYHSIRFALPTSDPKAKEGVFIAEQDVVHNITAFRLHPHL